MTITHRPSHLGLCVTDLARAERFWCDGLGFERAERYELTDTIAPGLAEALEVPAPVDLISQMIVLGEMKIELLYYRTPAVAIVVQALMSAGLVLVSGILVAVVDGFQQKSVFDMLTNFVIFSASIFYMLSVLAVILLRRRHPDWERPYRTWGYPLVPVAYLVFYCWFLWQVFWGQPFESVSGLALIALGLPVYFGWRKWVSRHPQNLTDGV